MGVVQSFVYRDAAGVPVARIDRIEPGWNGRSKEFLPYLYHTESQSYSENPGLNGRQLPIYHLDEVRDAIDNGQIIFFTEGEGKADQLRAALGKAKSKAVVTTINGGAAVSLHDHHINAFEDATRLVFLSDSDAPGRDGAKKRSQKIADVYPDCDVRVVDLFLELDDGSDIADWLAAGHSLRELRELVEAVARIKPSPITEKREHHSKTTQATEKDELAVTSIKKAPAWLTLGELLVLPEENTQWLVEGLLPNGGTSFLVAKPKVGKSTLAQNLAFCVARGEQFLGRDVKQGTVLYLALEEKKSELKKHFVSMGATAEDEIAFYVARAPEDGLAWLTREVEKRNPVLIIVDTFQRYKRLQDLNDYASVTNALDPLTNLARESGAHLMFTHHGKKGGGSDGDAVLGSTALFGAVDTLLEMRRRDKMRYLFSFQRYGEDLEETVIVLDLETFRVTPQGPKTEADFKCAQEQILKYLTTFGEAQKQADIYNGVGGRRQALIPALKELYELGKISRTGKGRKNDPYLYQVAQPDGEMPEDGSPNEDKPQLPKDSSILVPDIYREPENQNQKNGKTPNEKEVLSGSRDSASSEDAGNQNPNLSDAGADEMVWEPTGVEL